MTSAINIRLATNPPMRRVRAVTGPSTWMPEPTDMASSPSAPGAGTTRVRRDRKSTRLNSSHSQISYAVFCLKKKHICVSFDFTIDYAGLRVKNSDACRHKPLALCSADDLTNIHLYAILVAT